MYLMQLPGFGLITTMTALAAIGDGGVQVDNTISWTVATLPADDNVSFHLTLTVTGDITADSPVRTAYGLYSDGGVLYHTGSITSTATGNSAYGIRHNGGYITQNGDSVELDVQNCVLMHVEKDLIKAGIKPFVCPFLNIAAAAMRRNAGVKTAISKFEVDTENHRCSLCFELV